MPVHPDIILPPLSANVQRLADTGTTQDTSTALQGGAKATILVGAVAIRWLVAGSTPTVATTSPILPAYGRYDWDVVEGVSDIVGVEAADGASAYECHVFTSSPTNKIQ